MNKYEFYTQAERERLDEARQILLRLSGDALSQRDLELLEAYVGRTVETGAIRRDAFGLNPVLTDMETALVLAEEIGPTRGALLGVMLNLCVMSGACQTDEVARDFGQDVAHILHGLLRIRELYQKSAAVESENFRSLLVTFAEDMRVILIMIANRVSLMRLIRDTENLEAQKRVSMEAAYLYAPLAHKLGLYKLKSELEDLSLKYLEHDAYYHIKEKLNETKKSRDAYIARFIQPIEEKLKAVGLKFHMKGRTKSIHSIWQKMKKQNVGVDGVYDLFAIRIILDSAPEREKMDCWQTFSIIT
ncbi:MAG: bifunctional (p)ppGpp synthetase/guanosine-3',5'-bis(diphosphate) 3'-pyrophosphohydrolase, partial [Bacteroidaceae bacterium]|nr:bifunctional (p)ppGpp synthetase/guanosine-3',5'-bis(diphosphate) 3'-pyrophosphohydrolase [Bacteroidaceae bacterium]